MYSLWQLFIFTSTCDCYCLLLYNIHLLLTCFFLILEYPLFEKTHTRSVSWWTLFVTVVGVHRSIFLLLCFTFCRHRSPLQLKTSIALTTSDSVQLWIMAKLPWIESDWQPRQRTVLVAFFEISEGFVFPFSPFHTIFSSLFHVSIGDIFHFFCHSFIESIFSIEKNITRRTNTSDQEHAHRSRSEAMFLILLWTGKSLEMIKSSLDENYRRWLCLKKKGEGFILIEANSPTRTVCSLANEIAVSSIILTARSGFHLWIWYQLRRCIGWNKWPKKSAAIGRIAIHEITTHNSIEQ